MNGKIAARDRLCWRKVDLARRINDQRKTSKLNHKRLKNDNKITEKRDNKIKLDVSNSNSNAIGSVDVKLEKLKELLDRGLITVDEAAAKW